MTQQTYTVTGMTCGHCATAVSNELKELEGVSEVRVNVEAGTVEVESAHPLEQSQVAAAIDEAGYQLTGQVGA